MAQYRGVIQGSRGSVSRLGSKASGLDVSANGWNIGASVFLRYNAAEDRDEIEISLTHGSNRSGSFVRLGCWYEKDGAFITLS